MFAVCKEGYQGERIALHCVSQYAVIRFRHGRQMYTPKSSAAPPVYRPSVVQRQAAQVCRPSPVPVQQAIVPRGDPPVYRMPVNASAVSPIQAQLRAGWPTSANTGHLSSRPVSFVAQPSHNLAPYSRHAAPPGQLCPMVSSKSGAPVPPTPRPSLLAQIGSQRKFSVARLKANALVGMKRPVAQRYVTYGADHATRRRPTRTGAYKNLTTAQQRQIQRWQRDGDEHNFTDFNAMVIAATPLGGQFLSIPNGLVVPAASGGALSSTFDILAQFDSTNGGDHNTGEYRQHIRGTYQVNGAPHVHSLGGGRDLDANMDQEDGFQGTTYGHRDVFGTGSLFGNVVSTSVSHTFTPDPQNRGPVFWGQDTPSIRSARGNAVAMDLHFTGRMVDTSRPPTSPSYEIASSQWSVTGTQTL